MPIQNSLKFLQDMSKLGVDLVGVIKSGSSFLHIAINLAPIIKDLSCVIKDGKAALPEMKSLNLEEGLQLGEAAYQCIASIIQAI